MKISVVIAAYNEKGNAKELAERLYSVFNDLNLDFEIVFVVEGTDGTREELLSLPKNHNINLIYNEKPQGIGNAFITGFNAVSNDATHVLTMDADLNHQPEELPRLINALPLADIVIGSRYIKGAVTEGVPEWKKRLSKLVNIFMAFLYGLNVEDKTSGYRLMKKEVVDSIKGSIVSKNFELLPEFLIRAKKKGFSMVEVPITFKFRVKGESKLSLFRNFFSYAGLLIKCRK